MRKDIVDFLIFYKLLVVICKQCIAKKDEEIINDKIDKYQKLVGEIERQSECIEIRIKNLQNMNLGEPNFKVLP